MAHRILLTQSRCIVPVAAMGAAVFGVGSFFDRGASTSSSLSTHVQCEAKRDTLTPKNRIIFLGTGSSTGCPMPRCPMVFADDPTKGTGTDDELQEYQDLLKDKCRISALAAKGDPRDNPNYRNNPSLLISYTPEGEKSPKNVIIDVGKTFRETAIRWFPSKKVHFLDAVILTHEHADASFGMDDIRGFQKLVLEEENSPQKRRPQIPMPIYLSQDCLSKVAPQFKWLFPNHQPSKGITPPENEDEKVKVSRHVASLDVTVFESYKPFSAAGLDVIPLPIMHGEDLVSYGFAFSVGKTNIVYLSDISRMLPETMEFIQKQLPPTDILVVDALHPTKKHPVHFSMAQAIELAKELNPSRGSYLVGMNCDSFLPHAEQNEELAKKYGEGRIQMAKDGLEIDCL